MRVRKTRLDDVDSVCRIVEEAKRYFKEENIDQWQEGYPNKETILNDIQDSTSYVLVYGDKVIGTMRFVIDNDPDYAYIEGKWKSNQEYGVIHRLAISNHSKGNSYAKIFIDYAIQLCKEKGVHSLRIDTHMMNKSMRRFLNKNNFKECGYVYIRKKDKRIAYELQF